MTGRETPWEVRQESLLNIVHRHHFHYHVIAALDPDLPSISLQEFPGIFVFETLSDFN
jgi:hypothetical protein